MSYKNFEHDIMEKYKLKVVGWPDGLEVKNPSDIGSIDDLRRINRAWKSGQARFIELTGAEKKALAAKIKAREEAGELATRKRAERSDKGKTHAKRTTAVKSAAKRSQVKARRAKQRTESSSGSSDEEE